MRGKNFYLWFSHASLFTFTGENEMGDIVLMSMAFMLIAVSAYSLISYIRDRRNSSFPKKKR
ncbi:small membrane protein [Erwinia sp. E602]|uniref:small membrane protein n=1 Tax=Erwinia sp. E602 TaxID=2675378 RepID=UPI001BF12743|nr:small membrane protein [Erwinia sp. E602]